jgi:diguanylate cyclase (GGDEF)-like protein
MTRGSLRQRLFLVVLLSVMAVFIGYLGIQIFSDLNNARARTAIVTQDVATATVPLLKTTLITGDLATAQETLDNIMAHGQFDRLDLLAPETGRILLAGRPAPPLVQDSVPAWFASLLHIQFESQSFPLEVGGTAYGTLLAEPSARFLVADIWRHLWTALPLWLAALVFALGLVKFTLGRGLRPLDDLALAAHRLGDGDLTSRVPISNVPELAETARAFNGMADNLAEAQDKLEERVQQAVRDLNNLIARIPAGVYKLRVHPDDSMGFDYVSPRWCEQLGLEADTVYLDPQAPMTRLHPDEVESFIRLFDAAKASRSRFHWEGRLREGLQSRWLRIEATPTLQANGDVLWEGIQYDISDTKAREVELDRIAHYDTLTGIPNRVLLADRLRQAIAHAQRTQTSLAVCYLDLDGFKPVNDALGHEAGDMLLVEIAQRLHATVRGGDTVARIGGDEFVLLLADLTHVDEYETTLNRILDVVRAPVEIQGAPVSVSVSIGIALYPRDDGDPDMLLRHADQAMYLAKQAGCNKFIFFDPHQEDAARKHRELLLGIERGMAAQEFELYYEPRVNLRQGTVLGFEALIRWNRGDELLLTEDFLPLIEDNDLIVVLGEWMLDQVLAQLAAWQQQGLDVRVSVNIATRQLRRGDFSATLRRLLARHTAVPPARLEIEITESVALADTQKVAELIGECRKLGVSFALDDFGTGYSSLTYLKNLPAQTLKIDPSFVRDMLVDANDLAIVEGVIGLTDIFRRQVVAEGVDSVEHGTLLLNLGCEVAQGRSIAPPMAAGDVADWLGTWQPDPTWTASSASRWPRDDLPLVVAENNHRAWVEALVRHVEQPDSAIPEVDPAHCRFGQWYNGSGRNRYGHLAEYAAIAGVHERIHALGQTLLDLTAQGNQELARARLPELFALRDALLALLAQLMADAATIR